MHTDLKGSTCKKRCRKLSLWDCSWLLPKVSLFEDLGLRLKNQLLLLLLLLLLFLQIAPSKVLLSMNEGTIEIVTHCYFSGSDKLQLLFPC